MRIALAFVGVAVLQGTLTLVRAESLEQPPSSPAHNDEIAKLIEQLGSSKFAERKTAFERLEALGEAARQPLESAENHKDRHIRREIGRLLQSLKHRQYLAFVEDTGGVNNTSLPAWESFRKIVGDHPHTRRMFLRMYQDASDLLDLYEENPAAAGERLDEQLRILKLIEIDKQPPHHCAIALLLVGDSRIKISERLCIVVGRMCGTLRSSDKMERETLSALVASWVKRPLTDPGIRVRLNMARRHNLREEAVAIVKYLLRPDDAQAVNLPERVTERMDALATAPALLDPKSCVALVEPWLDDTNLFAPADLGGDWQPVEIRDAALCALPRAENQRLNSISGGGCGQLDEMGVPIEWPYGYRLCTFKTAQQREEAIANWRAWAEANLREKKPAPSEPAR